MAQLKSAKLCNAFLRIGARESTQNICLCVEQHRDERDSRDDCYHDQRGKYLRKSCKIRCIQNPKFPPYGVFSQEPNTGLHHLSKLTVLMISQFVNNPLARSMMILLNIFQK